MTVVPPRFGVSTCTSARAASAAPGSHRRRCTSSPRQAPQPSDESGIHPRERRFPCTCLVRRRPAGAAGGNRRGGTKLRSRGNGFSQPARDRCVRDCREPFALGRASRRLRRQRCRTLDPSEAAGLEGRGDLAPDHRNRPATAREILLDLLRERSRARLAQSRASATPKCVREGTKPSRELSAQHIHRLFDRLLVDSVSLFHDSPPTGRVLLPVALVVSDGCPIRRRLPRTSRKRQS